MSVFNEEALWERLRDEVRRVVREELDRKRDVAPRDAGPCFTIEEAAKHYNVSTDTVRGWLDDGLPHLRRDRTIRIERSELRAFLQPKLSADKQAAADLERSVESVLARLPSGITKA